MHAFRACRGSRHAWTWSSVLLVLVVLSRYRADAVRQEPQQQRVPVDGQIHPWGAAAASPRRAGAAFRARTRADGRPVAVAAAAPGRPATGPAPPTARRALKDHEPNILLPNASAAVCPGPIVPGAKLLVRVSCVVGLLPRRLGMPGAEMAGVPSKAVSLPTVIVDDNLENPQDIAVQP
ncbi:hypothetical protein MNEG_12677, partial [Monoraphidium neglectum]